MPKRGSLSIEKAKTLLDYAPKFNLEDVIKNYYNYKNFFLNKIKYNEVKYIYFIGKRKHKMNFFDDLLYENKCMNSRKINDLLIEFNISQCKQIL